MIKHSFKIIWNQKKKNLYIILELFVLFVVLLISSVYLIGKYEIFNEGLGANLEDTYFMYVLKKDYQDGDYQNRLKKLQDELESHPDIKKVSYSIGAIPYSWSSTINGIECDSLSVGVFTRKADENFADVFEIKMITGNWLKDDFQSAYPQIVIDIMAAEKIFGSTNNAINKVVKYNGNEMLVVGVYDKFKHEDYEENMPSCFYAVDLSKISSIEILIKFNKDKMVLPTRLSTIVFSYFNKNEFTIMDSSTMEAKRVDGNAGMQVEIVMVSFVAVFLVINIILGMIGILGYSIKKRKSELGLRRAVGSSAQKINTLILFESWTLTLFALIPAILITVQIPLLNLYPVETTLFIKAICLSIVLIFTLVSLSVYYPGYLASKVQASEALQEE